MRPPRTRQEHYLRVCRAREELTQALGRGPTPTEVAAHTDLLVDEVLGAMEAGGARTSHSLEPARENDEPVVARAETASWDRGFADFESHSDLLQALGALDERERCVLHLRFVEELSQPEIAERLGISQSYVSRIIRGALATLREQMDDERSAPMAAGTVPAAMTTPS